MIDARARRLILLTLLLITGATIGIIAVRTLEQNLVYYLTPRELLARDSPSTREHTRLGGIVCEGTMTDDATREELTFTVGMDESCHGPSVRARVAKATPRMLREGIAVVLEGRYDGRVFHAERLMVKHGNTYHPKIADPTARRAPGDSPARASSCASSQGRARAR